MVYLDMYCREFEPSHLTIVQFVSTTLLALCTIPFLETAYLDIDVNFVLVLFYLVLMPTIVALYVMAKYQQYTTPTRSAIIYSMEPPFAAIFAFLVLGEILGFIGIFGALIIISGLIVSELSDVIFK
jgi:drug/metabolite transporter (DMT)-like permease